MIPTPFNIFIYQKNTYKYIHTSKVSMSLSVCMLNNMELNNNHTKNIWVLLY
jgi:hypothetical protein